MNQVDAFEYSNVHRLRLSGQQRDALLESGADISLAPEAGADDLWKLGASCKVGTVVVPGLTVRIHPKVAIARLFVMLSAAAGSIHWDDRAVGLAESSMIEDVVATALVEAVARALKSGLLRGYVQEEEEAFVVRGRIDFTQTIRRRPASLVPFVQSPVFLKENTPENQVLATALASLLPTVQTGSVRARLVAALSTFSEVDRLPPGRPLPRFFRNRLNARWWGAIDLALLVLQSCGLDLPRGRVLSRSFLIDMNVVFERFVYQALANALPRPGPELQHNRGGLYLDDAKTHALRPDLSLWRGSTCIFAGDCKYKNSDDGNARREDVYQALAYSTAIGLHRVMLIYAGAQDIDRDVRIVGGGPVVQIRTVALGESNEHLQARFRRLGAEVVA
jgi:5-methylcytosine-specific restriction enzyme subunit McrC